jgi:hypothetical protein
VAPTSGRKAPRKVRMARGRTRGTPMMSRPIPMITASTVATTAVPFT